MTLEAAQHNVIFRLSGGWAFCLCVSTNATKVVTKGTRLMHTRCMYSRAKDLRVLSPGMKQLSGSKGLRFFLPGLLSLLAFSFS